MNIQTFQPTYRNINFCAMKKSQFSGIDYAVVEKYNAPIEKFNSHDDFDKWSQEKCYETLDIDLGGRDSNVIRQRQRAQDEWEHELKKESYTPAEQLIILKGIISGIKATNDTPIPIYSRQVLHKSISDLEQKLAADKSYQFNFGTTYRNNLKDFYMDSPDSDYTGWIKIPSRDHDRENFKDNVKRLVSLSSVHWCTKANHALSYLADGDFHIYMDKGNPKIGVRVIDEQVEEIEDDLNRRILPPDYFKILNEYVKENNFTIHNNAKNSYLASLNKSAGIKIAKDLLGDELKEENAEKIFNLAGIKTQKDKNGKLILSHFEQPEYYNFSELGINEDKLFEHVSEILGDANFKGSELQNLNNLKKIHGNADFKFSKVKNLGNLKYIGGDVNFSYSRVENLCNLTKINGNADFSYSSVHNLGELNEIGGNANFYYSNVCTMGSLESIGGNANFSSTIMESLNRIRYIGGDVLFGYTHLKDMGDLREIGGDAKFIGIKLDNLGCLKRIGGNLQIHNSTIGLMNKLEHVGGNIDILDSNISSCKNLKTVDGEINIANSTFPIDTQSISPEKKESAFKKFIKFFSHN